MNIVPIKQLNRAIVHQFFTNHWGSPQMVVSTGIYNCSELDGFAAVENGQRIIGLITFVIRGNECEIISLDSIMENRGVGSTLLHEAETWARQQRCTAVQLITTNDNLHALRFYQKRGYQIVNVFPNAVDKARRIKPSIPKTSPDGIPIRDELLLVKPLA